MKAVDEMTYRELVLFVLGRKGIDIVLDGTGMAFMAVDEDGTKIVGPSANPKVTIYHVLDKCLVKET